MTSTTKLKHAPLVHVIAQVRFEPVTYIEKSIPELQEPLKKLGFPRFKKSTIQQFALDGAQPRIDTLTRWDFADREQHNSVAITSDFVAVQTSRYDVFPTFARLLHDVFQIVRAHTDVEVVQRLGIRYVDVVRPRTGTNFEDYLQPGLVGYPFGVLENVSFKQQLSNTQSVGETASGGTLVVKCLQNNIGQILPPDLIPSELAYDLSVNAGEMIAILDFDHFQTLDADFEPDDLIRRFDLLHSVANEAFRKAVTAEAVRIWND